MASRTEKKFSPDREAEKGLADDQGGRRERGLTGSAHLHTDHLLPGMINPAGDNNLM